MAGVTRGWTSSKEPHGASGHERPAVGGCETRSLPGRRLAIVMISLIFGVAGCSSLFPASTTQSSASSTQPAPSGTAGPLRLGERVTVPTWDGSGFDNKAEVAVTAIEQARPEDLAAFRLDPKDAGKRPWFLRYQVRNLGPKPMTAAALSTEVRPVETTGQRLTRLLPLGPVPRCVDEFQGTVPAGETRTACDIYLVPEGGSISEAQYKPTTGPYARNPVRWLS